MKKSIFALKSEFDLHPWLPHINLINENLTHKPDRTELHLLRSDIMPKIKEFSNTLDDFQKQLDEFNRNQERFDEIMLDKANKDDIRS